MNGRCANPKRIENSIWLIALAVMSLSAWVSEGLPIPPAYPSILMSGTSRLTANGDEDIALSNKSLRKLGGFRY